MNFKEFCKRKAEEVKPVDRSKLRFIDRIIIETAEEYAEQMKDEALQQQRKEEKKKTALQKIKEAVEV